MFGGLLSFRSPGSRRRKYGATMRNGVTYDHNTYHHYQKSFQEPMLAIDPHDLRDFPASHGMPMWPTQRFLPVIDHGHRRAYPHGYDPRQHGYQVGIPAEQVYGANQPRVAVRRHKRHHHHHQGHPHRKDKHQPRHGHTPPVAEMPSGTKDHKRHRESRHHSNDSRDPRAGVMPPKSSREPAGLGGVGGMGAGRQRTFRIPGPQRGQAPGPAGDSLLGPMRLPGHGGAIGQARPLPHPLVVDGSARGIGMNPFGISESGAGSGSDQWGGGPPSGGRNHRGFGGSGRSSARSGVGGTPGLRGSSGAHMGAWKSFSGFRKGGKSGSSGSEEGIESSGVLGGRERGEGRSKNSGGGRAGGGVGFNSFMKLLDSSVGDGGSAGDKRFWRSDDRFRG